MVAVNGTSGNDTLSGGPDNDVITGAGGRDTLTGGAGSDIFAYPVRQFGDDTITDFTQGQDKIDLSALNIADMATLTPFITQSGNDTVISFTYRADGETIRIQNVLPSQLTAADFIFNTSTNPLTVTGTGSFNSTGVSDTLFGGLGNDTIDGKDGNDRILGGSGNDTIIGGLGNDTMTGGPGSDKFVYLERQFGDDTITDFTQGQDKIDLSALGIADMATIAPFITQSGNDTVITFGYRADGESIRIQNVLPGQLTADDFVFNTSTNPLTVTGTGSFNSKGVSDTLFGGLGNDTIDGRDGNDRIVAGSGNDTIIGGVGSDTMTGGPGNDLFLGTKAEFKGDTITDFSPGDKIQISDAISATISLSGSTLTYDGGTMTLQNLPAGYHLSATALPTNGIEITLVANPGGALLNNGLSGDFNGDGKDDLLWRNDNGQLSDWLGKANGGFASNDANAFSSVPVDWKVVGAGDFNGDGKDDLLWRNSVTGQLSDWLGQANGGFVSNDANAFSSAPLDWKVVGTGDFNGDGKDDLVWRNAVTGQVSDWLGQANGGFVGNDANAFASVPVDWKIVGTGDFNGDGKDDLLWRNSVNGQLSDWLGKANGGFTANDANAFSSAPTNWHVVGTGDFNGDGRDDILWRNDAGQLSSWLGQANGGFVSNDANAFSAAPLDWQVAGTGDFNGDGRDDVLWRNVTTGTVSDWLGQANGGFVSNDANALVAGVPLTWQIQVADNFAI